MELAITDGLPSHEEALSFGDVSVRMLCASGLETRIDAAALLSAEDAPEPPYWMHLWPGATALARKMARAGEVGPGVRILELGCGLGLPALVAATRGARVVAADRMFEPLAFVRRSARLNARSVDLLQMDWREPALGGAFDLCAGADIAYDRATEDALIRAARTCLRSGGKAWLADSVNTHRRTLPDGLEAAGFAVRIDHVRETDEGRPVWVRIIEAERRV